jgi:hypothetical protein
MDSLRKVAHAAVWEKDSCRRCGAAGSFWDRIAGVPYCPDCEESLAAGEGPPLIARTRKHPCTVCARPGSVAYLTFPLNVQGALEMDLCAGHVRALLSRSLRPSAFGQLRRQLANVGVGVEHIFLLHEVFYDEHGRALQPVVQAE